MKRKNIFLYLTLACFIGIILIFVFDGYLGLYDTFSVTSVNFPQKIDVEQWQQQEDFGFAPQINVDSSGDVPFTYEVDNRRFSSYRADIVITLWHNQTKLADLKSGTLALGAFNKGQLDWVTNFESFIPDNLPAGSSYDFTILITRGEVERRVIVYTNPKFSLPGPVVPGRVG